eukprot:Gb_02829 [translate_table: standard]
MGSRMKEDEKNEKIIRGLMKLPPNRRCVKIWLMAPSIKQQAECVLLGGRDRGGVSSFNWDAHRLKVDMGTGDKGHVLFGQPMPRLSFEEHPCPASKTLVASYRSIIGKPRHRVEFQLSFLPYIHGLLDIWDPNMFAPTSGHLFVLPAAGSSNREFTHRVKSVSMAKFTSQEVASLQRGGNQRARESYFKEWDPQRHSLPDSSNIDRLRDFIKNVYVEKRYAGDRAFDRPPRGKLGDRDDTYENRRPASYHSDSRSPPYEEKYEEHRHGERRALGAQKLESDRGSFDDKTSRFGYGERKSPGGYGSDRGRNDRGYYNNHDNYKRSSGRFEMARNRYEDRFANERLDRRFEDRSFSDARDIQRWDGRSPNYQRDFDIASPPVRPVRDILGDDVPTLRVGDFPRANGHRDTDGSVRSHRTASSSSIGSFDSSSLSLKGVNIESLIDFSSEPECPAAPVQQDPFAVSLFSQSSTGWATFDFAHHVSQAPAPATVVPTLEPSPGIVDSFGKANNAEQWPPVQQINGSRPVAPGVENLVPISLPVQPSTGIPSSQSWNAFPSFPTPMPSAAQQNTQPEKAAQKQGQQTFKILTQHESPSAASTEDRRKEIPEDYFKPAYPEPVLPSIDFNWGSQHGHAGSGSQFASSGMYLLGPKPSYVQHLKSTNPFDLPDDSPAAPTNVVWIFLYYLDDSDKLCCLHK